MSDPMRVFCRTCGEAAYGPDGMYCDTLQEWYDIRHELCVVRKNWPGWTDSPMIDRDDGELTRFLCNHKDHDLCMTEPYHHDKVTEFKKPEPKPEKARRVFRELRSAGMTSDLLEVDDAPRLHYSIVKPRKVSVWDSGLGSSAPEKAVRFVFKREEQCVVRVYEEEGDK